MKWACHLAHSSNGCAVIMTKPQHNYESNNSIIERVLHVCGMAHFSTFY